MDFAHEVKSVLHPFVHCRRCIPLDIDTQASRITLTDASGFYAVTSLPIGNYRVEANKEGFKSQSQLGQNLVADGRLTVNFALDVGNLAQSVEI